MTAEPEKAKTVELVERAMELTDAESQYRIPWIVFDRDQCMVMMQERDCLIYMKYADKLRSQFYGNKMQLKSLKE